MTITVTIRRRPPPRDVFAVAAELTKRDMDASGLTKVLQAGQERLKKQEWRRQREAIHRYAKKHHLELRYHPKPWIFRCFEGRIQVSLPVGYFALVDGVLHQIVAE